MDISFTDWDSGIKNDELYHYGTKGMRWGQRRYQNEDGSLTQLGKERYGKQGYVSARRAQRTLNKLDKEQAEAAYRARQLGRVDKIKALNQKREKAIKAGKTDKAYKYGNKIEKLQNLSPKKREKIQAYNKIVQRSRRMTERVLKTAKKLGYSIKSKEVQRYVQSNRDKVLNMVSQAAAIGMMSATLAYGPEIVVRSGAGSRIAYRSYKVGFGIAPSFGGVSKGTQYKVKKNKKRSVTE